MAFLTSAAAVITAVADSSSHIVLGADLYGGTYRLVDKVLTRWGLAYDMVDQTDLERWFGNPRLQYYLDAQLERSRADKIRVERLRFLARNIGPRIGADHALSDRAALLAKADLVTDMVGEFPELQGTMGRYYATHDGEAPQVADAIADTVATHRSGSHP